jgi:hypothetical protein
VQPLKHPPAFYGTRSFNTVFTRALHWYNKVRKDMSVESIIWASLWKDQVKQGKFPVRIVGFEVLIGNGELPNMRDSPCLKY